MDIIIQSLGFKAGDSLENFTREKINTLKDDKIIRVNVILYKGPDSAPENNYCEIRLEVPGNDPFVKKHSAHFETAISECVDVLAGRLHRDKENKNHRGPDKSAIIQDAMDETETADDMDETL